MSSSNLSDADRRRALKVGLRARMRRVAESRKCPVCTRKQALGKVLKLCAEDDPRRRHLN